MKVANTNKCLLEQQNSDEPSEIALMEGEYVKLQRAYRLMQKDYKRYKEVTYRTLKNHELQKISLWKERTELENQLMRMEDEYFARMDGKNLKKLNALIAEEKEIKKLICDEEKIIEELKKKIDKFETKIRQKTQQSGTLQDVHTKHVSMLSKRIHLENDLHRATVRFNKQLTLNRQMREQIEALRGRRALFEKFFNQLSLALAKSKKQLQDILEISRQAFESRDEAKGKIIALQERNKKDQQRHDVDMRDVLRDIVNLDQMKEFMTIKNNDRKDLIEEEWYKKYPDGITDEEKSVKAQIETIAKYERAFDIIRKVTGEESLDTIVDQFIKKEEENYAKFTYINELNNEAEMMQEEITMIRDQTKKLKQDNMLAEDHRHENLLELETKYNKTAKESDKIEGQLRQTNKSLDQLKSSIEMLFKRLNCNPEPLELLLGHEKGITNKNVMLYLKLIEDKVEELLRVIFFEKMQRADREMRRPSILPRDKPMPNADDMHVSIKGPTSAPGTAQEVEDIPLSQEQMRAKVLQKVMWKEKANDEARGRQQSVERVIRKINIPEEVEPPNMEESGGGETSPTSAPDDQVTTEVEATSEVEATTDAPTEAPTGAPTETEVTTDTEAATDAAPDTEVTETSATEDGGNVSGEAMEGSAGVSGGEGGTDNEDTAAS